MFDYAASVAAILVNTLGVSADAVTPAARIQEDLGADSLQAVEIVMDCEDEFEIEIDDDDQEAVVTVADLVALVERLA